MNFNPNQHHRHSIRLKGYDYSLAGAYFITIVAHGWRLFFGEIINREIHLVPLGQIAKECWQAIPDHFPNVEVQPFVIMPNHIHGVITIHDDPGRGTISCMRRHDRAPTIDRENFGHPVVGSLPTIIRTYKSAVSRRARRELLFSDVWQRNYYDHIIRNEEEFRKIWDYIDTNPHSWAEDQLYP
jgi:putative transposase